MKTPVQDLKGHLRRGVALEELWRVSRGELRYPDWVQQRAGPQVPPQALHQWVQWLESTSACIHDPACCLRCTLLPHCICHSMSSSMTLHLMHALPWV